MDDNVYTGPSTSTISTNCFIIGRVRGLPLGIHWNAGRLYLVGVDKKALIKALGYLFTNAPPSPRQMMRINRQAMLGKAWAWDGHLWWSLAAQKNAILVLQ